MRFLPIFMNIRDQQCLVVGGGQRPPGSRRKRYEPCFFLISAVPKDDGWQLPLPIAELLAWLWQRWEAYQDRLARAKLIRYCIADVLSLSQINHALLKRKAMIFDELRDVPWALLESII